MTNQDTPYNRSKTMVTSHFLSFPICQDFEQHQCKTNASGVCQISGKKMFRFCATCGIWVASDNKAHIKSGGTKQTQKKRIQIQSPLPHVLPLEIKTDLEIKLRNYWKTENLSRNSSCPDFQKTLQESKIVIEDVEGEIEIDGHKFTMIAHAFGCEEEDELNLKSIYQDPVTTKMFHHDRVIPDNEWNQKRDEFVVDKMWRSYCEHIKDETIMNTCWMLHLKESNQFIGIFSFRNIRNTIQNTDFSKVIITVAFLSSFMHKNLLGQFVKIFLGLIAKSSNPKKTSTILIASN